MSARLLLLLLVIPTATTGAFQISPQLSGLQSSRLVLHSVPNAFDTLTSGLASICRLPHGVTAAAGGSSNSNSDEAQQLTLYDIENDINCRLVRERLTELDLNFKVVPATPNSKVFTDPSYQYALPKGTTIPALYADDNKMMTGATDIVNYLDTTFGDGSKDDITEEQDFVAQAITVLSSAGNTVASLLRIGRGCNVSPAANKVPTDGEQPLIVLYSYDGNQFCRLVREVLTELDIVYDCKSAGKTSPRREELAQLTGGSSQCPYLIDDGAVVSMAESGDIIKYLYKTYAKYTPPNEVMQFVSDKVLPVIKPLFGLLTKVQAGQQDPDYEEQVAKATAEIELEMESAPVVVYTYDLSPFSWETKSLLDSLNVEYKEVSLGKEWFPGFINEGGAQKRAALLEMTGQSSLPHVFVGGTWVGGLFGDKTGLIPALNDGSFWDLLEETKKSTSQDAVGAFE